MAKKIARPTELEIAHMEWTIKWVKYIPDHKEDKGITDTEEQIIWVATRFGRKTQQHVLLHEVLHAIWYSHHVQPGKKDVEEDVISALSGPLMTVLSAHAPLRAFLFPE